MLVGYVAYFTCQLINSCLRRHHEHRSLCKLYTFLSSLLPCCLLLYVMHMYIRIKYVNIYWDFNKKSMLRKHKYLILVKEKVAYVALILLHFFNELWETLKVILYFSRMKYKTVFFFSCWDKYKVSCRT